MAVSSGWGVVLAVCAVVILHCSAGFPDDQDDTDHVAVADNKRRSKLHERERPPVLTDEGYDAVVKYLRTTPKTAKTKDERKMEYLIKKHGLQLQVVADPYRGEKLERLIKGGKILLPPSELRPCVEHFSELTRRDGNTKLTEQLRLYYFGISRGSVTRILCPQARRPRPSPVVTPKQCLCKSSARLVQAKEPMERHQVDLVDMSSLAHLVSDKEMKPIYVLSVIDCFSRFVWVRLLTEKSSEAVAAKLEELYLETGTPKIIQSDRGREFPGAIETLCERLGITLMYSFPHRHGLQGKIERSHSTWKKKLRTLVNKAEVKNKDWTKSLPLIIKLYNDAYHSAIKMSPYKLLYGVESNFKLTSFKGGLMKEYKIFETGSENGLEGDVTDDDVNDTDDNVNDSALPPLRKRQKICSLETDRAPDIINSSSMFEERMRDVTELRRQALENDSRKVAQMLNHCFVSEHPSNPPAYAEGELVFVKCKDKGVRTDCLTPAKYSVHKGIVCDKSINSLYKIALISKERWGELVKVSVKNMVSLTKQQEESGANSNAASSVGKTKSTLDQIKSLLTTSSSETGLELLLKNAAGHGMVLDSDNSGNGNCMFLAIQQQLEKIGQKKSYKEIRKEIVEFLTKNPIIGTDEDVVYLPHFVDNWGEYLNELEQDGVWGDHIALIGAANLYNIGIWIVSTLPDAEPIVVAPASGNPVGDIYLGHISELHYVTLQPASQATLINWVLCDSCGQLGPHTCCDQSWVSGEKVCALLDNKLSGTSSASTAFCDSCGLFGTHACIDQSLVSFIKPCGQLDNGRGWCQSYKSWCKGNTHTEAQISGHRPTRFEISSEQRQAKTVQCLSNDLLIFIFALATVYSEKTVQTISLVCKRWKDLITSPKFQQTLCRERRKRAPEQETLSYEGEQAFSVELTAAQLGICKRCGKEYQSGNDRQHESDKLVHFRSAESEFCSQYCKYMYSHNHQSSA